MRLFVLIFSLLISSCQPYSMEDFQAEGAAQVRALLKELRSIQSREDLTKISPALKKRFEKMVDLMILAKSFQQKKQIAGNDIYFLIDNQVLNESLLEELKRVYKLEGGRECVEKAEREAMLRLDAKQKLLDKQKAFHLN